MDTQVLGDLESSSLPYLNTTHPPPKARRATRSRFRDPFLTSPASRRFFLCVCPIFAGIIPSFPVLQLSAASFFCFFFFYSDHLSSPRCAEVTLRHQSRVNPCRLVSHTTSICLGLQPPPSLSCNRIQLQQLVHKSISIALLPSRRFLARPLRSSNLSSAPASKTVTIYQYSTIYSNPHHLGHGFPVNSRGPKAQTSF